MPGQQQYRPGAVSAHGPIHHRSRGMFSRYRPCYWAHVHPATLVVFDGREDFLRWGLENREGRGDGVTSNLVDMQDGSVRACLNLDPTGAVRRREKAERRRKKEERRGRKKGGGRMRRTEAVGAGAGAGAGADPAGRRDRGPAGSTGPSTSCSWTRTPRAEEEGGAPRPGRRRPSGRPTTGSGTT